MKQVAPGVYIETEYASGNVGMIVTGAGVVCIDVPMLPSEVYHWRAQIESVTNEPIIALVQTDYDQSRIVSTYLLDVPLIAHDTSWVKMKMYSSEKVTNQIKDLLRRDGTEQDWRVRMPDITFSERLVLHKGEREIHVVYGGGHSPATCMVYLAEDNLIFTGDVVFCGMHPTMSQAESKQWLASLTALRKMAVDVLVPGHGDLCDRNATQGLSEYIRDMRAVVRRNFPAGRSKSETSSSVIPEFIGAFPYKENERDRVRAWVKGGSDRIYDEYRTMAKNSATNRSTGKRRRKRS